MEMMRKTTAHRKRSFTKRKNFHKISLQVQEIVEILHICSSSFNKFIQEQATIYS